MITPEFAFDVCHQVYRAAFALAFEQCGLRCLDAEDLRERKRHIRAKPTVLDYVADFAIAGREALGRQRSWSRLVLFEMYFAGQADYEPARRVLGIAELTWANWVEEIRRTVGKELLRKGLFPPRRYFEG